MNTTPLLSAMLLLNYYKRSQYFPWVKMQYAVISCFVKRIFWYIAILFLLFSCLFLTILFKPGVFQYIILIFVSLQISFIR